MSDVNLDEMREYRRYLETAFNRPYQNLGFINPTEILAQFDALIEEADRLQKKIKHLSKTQSPRGYGVGQ